MTTTTVQRGRPRKTSEELLAERLTMRLTPRDRQLLEEICRHYGQAPEAYIRAKVLPPIREEYKQLFGDDTSALIA